VVYFINTENTEKFCLVNLHVYATMSSPIVYVAFAETRKSFVLDYCYVQMAHERLFAGLATRALSHALLGTAS